MAVMGLGTRVGLLPLAAFYSWSLPDAVTSLEDDLVDPGVVNGKESMIE
jgi:hypothetical protein